MTRGVLGGGSAGVGARSSVFGTKSSLRRKFADAKLFYTIFAALIAGAGLAAAELDGFDDEQDHCPEEVAA